MAIALGSFVQARRWQGEEMSQRSYLNVAAFRNCIHAMTDPELIGFGRVCRSLKHSSHTAHTARFESICNTQFHECKQEWKRRHSRDAS
jgi:hypothetical protein